MPARSQPSSSCSVPDTSSAREVGASASRPLLGKRILMISPQPWNYIEISKHHYARVLGRGNDVVFLQPPDLSLSRGVIRLHDSGVEGVTLADWRPLTPKWFRFHAHPAYAALVRLDARRIRAEVGNRLDLLWCFDVNLFPDLRAFGARFNIFHPVDPLSDSRHAAVGRSADLILTVSDKILRSVAMHGVGTPSAVINHGVGPDFALLSRTESDSGRREGPVHCGYFGHLDRPVINARLLERIARENPLVTFHFWGPATPGGLVHSALSSLPNCLLHGAVGKRELAEAASKMDCFVIAYVDDPSESDRSNSHKLLEYFATGRVTISTRMECYDDPDLLIMSRLPGDEDFPALFASVVAKIDAHNTPAKSARRKAVAAQYTYEGNVARIEALIEQLDRMSVVQESRKRR